MNIIDAILYLMVTLSCSKCATSVLTPVNDYEAALRRELFDEKRYDPSSSPVSSLNPHKNGSSSLEIHLLLLILHIHDLDELTGTLTTNSWFLSFWDDYRLQWEPKDYGDVFVASAQFHSVWIPEFALINDVEAMVMNKIADANVFIYQTGTVYWAVPINLKTSCYIDHKFYPFDEHSCKISIRLWSMTVSRYTLTVNYITTQHETDMLMNFATDNPLWEVTSRKNEIRNLTFDCCPYTAFPVFETAITLRRRAPLFKYIFITPGMISILLTLTLFWLPPTASAKIGLGGFVVAIQIALLSFLGWRIPSGGKSIPVIVLFCGNTLVMAALAVVISVIVIRISKTSKETAIPDWIKFLNREPCKTILCFGSAESQVWVRFVAKVGFTSKDKDDAALIDSEGIDAECQSNPAKAAVQSDWLLIGAAIDRLCFIIYCIVIGLIITTSFS